MAQTLSWNGGTDDWNTATNWTPNAVPQSADTAIIDVGTAELASGVNPADGVTLALDGSIGQSGTTVAAVLTQGTNVVFGSGFQIEETLPGAQGVLLTSGTTTFEGSMLIGAPASTGSLEALAIGVDSYDNGAISGDFINAGVISVVGGGALAVLNLAPETPYSPGGKRAPVEMAAGVSSVGGGTVQINVGSIVLDNGDFVAIGSLPLESGTITMSNTSAAVITDAVAQTHIVMEDGSERLAILQSPGFITNYSMAADIFGFRPGDKLVLQNATIGSVSYDTTNQILDVEDPGGSLIAILNVIGTYASDAFTFTNTPSSGTVDAFGTIFMPCFAAGSRIATPGGERAVETLAEGDAVLTASGRAAPVRWIGQRRIDCRRHPLPEKIYPVCIRAHAFGPDRPRADLLLSPDHAVYAEGLLVPVRHLINGATIVQEPLAGIHYFHVELDRHDILLAEGLAVESYLDTGNRAQFANGADQIALHSDFAPCSWTADACAPLCLSGRKLTKLRRRLIARAQKLGYRASIAAMPHLVAGGQRIAPARTLGPLHRFLVPGHATAAVLVSESGVPAGFDASRDDFRQLGVALRGIVIDGRPLPLDHPSLRRGFHAPERASGAPWRWTDGAGEIPLPRARGRTGRFVVDLLLAQAMHAWRAPVPHAEPAIWKQRAKRAA